MMEKTYQVSRDGKPLVAGEVVVIREWLEDELKEHVLGFYPMLQENDQEEMFEIYLHSEWMEELEAAQVEKIHALGLNEYDSTETIRNLLGLEFNAVQAGEII